MGFKWALSGFSWFLSSFWCFFCFWKRVVWLILVVFFKSDHVLSGFLLALSPRMCIG